MSSGPIPLTLPSSNATIWMSTHTMQFRLKGRMVMSGEQTMYNNHCALFERNSSIDGQAERYP